MNWFKSALAWGVSKTWTFGGPDKKPEDRCGRCGKPRTEHSGHFFREAQA